MKTRDIVLMASAGGVFLLCAAGVWFAYDSYAKSSKVRSKLDGTYNTLKKIYDADPFPSTNNVALLQRETAWLSGWHRTLADELRAAAAPSESPTPGGFIQKLQNVSAELHRKAAAEGGKVLADEFAFGFERYLGGTSEMPKSENVKRLALQLAMVDAVTREILDSHVNAISQIGREVFEGESGEAPVTSGRSRRPAPAAAAAPVADARYPCQHFTFTFVSDERSLATVLVRLAKMPMFVMVADLRIDREDRGLQPRPEKSPAEADKGKPAAAAAPAQRVVSGPEIAPLLKTQMQVDVYTFEGV